MLRPPLLEFHTLVGELVYDVASFELACRRLFWLGLWPQRFVGAGMMFL